MILQYIIDCILIGTNCIVTFLLRGRKFSGNISKRKLFSYWKYLRYKYFWNYNLIVHPNASKDICSMLVVLSRVILISIKRGKNDDVN